LLVPLDNCLSDCEGIRERQKKIGRERGRQGEGDRERERGREREKERGGGEERRAEE
jgi:hypothetical protein